MVSFQNRERVALVHPNQQCATKAIATAQTMADGVYLNDALSNTSAKRPRSDALGNINKQETAVCDPPPLRTRKNPDELQV
jgi:hypothetical protein